MKWSEIKDKDRFISEKVMGWQPALCDGEIGELPSSPDGWFCQSCGFLGSWGDSFEHEQLPKVYTKNIELALQAVEQAQKKYSNAMFYITSEMHRHDPYEAHFLYPVTVQEEVFSHVEDKHIQGACQRDKLAETICYVVAQAIGIVKSEEDE